MAILTYYTNPYIHPSVTARNDDNSVYHCPCCLWGFTFWPIIIMQNAQLYSSHDPAATLYVRVSASNGCCFDEQLLHAYALDHQDVCEHFIGEANAPLSPSSNIHLFTRYIFCRTLMVLVCIYALQICVEKKLLIGIDSCMRACVCVCHQLLLMKISLFFSLRSRTPPWPLIFTPINVGSSLAVFGIVYHCHSLY